MAENNQIRIDNHKYQVYLDERKALIDANREAARLFDKAILTLTAGAFGLSLAFIRQIAPSIREGTIYCLIFGWAGFSLSLLSTLISFLSSQYACKRQIEILELDYIDNQNSLKEKNIPAILTKCLNILSIFFFILGLVFLAIFIILNLPK